MMPEKTDFEKFGYAASLAKKADRLGVTLRWLHNGWRASHAAVKGSSNGKTLESLDAFLKGFEIGLAVAEDDDDGEPRDLEGFEDGWCCDDPGCDCHDPDDDPDADEGDEDDPPF